MERDRHYRLLPAPLRAYQQSLAVASGTLANLSHAMETVRRTCGIQPGFVPCAFPWSIWNAGFSVPQLNRRPAADQRMLHASLRELIVALDRRAPRPDGELNRRIASDAADLRSRAQARLAEIESQMLPADLVDGPTTHASDCR